MPKCSLYNNVKPPSWLNPGTDLQLFKEGIEPKWEDPKCENGGKWTVQIPKAPNGKATLDAYWLNAVSVHEIKYTQILWFASPIDTDNLSTLCIGLFCLTCVSQNVCSLA